jgi:hypothetical protein
MEMRGGGWGGGGGGKRVGGANLLYLWIWRLRRTKNGRSKHAHSMKLYKGKWHIWGLWRERKREIEGGWRGGDLRPPPSATTLMRCAIRDQQFPHLLFHCRASISRGKRSQACTCNTLGRFSIICFGWRQYLSMMASAHCGTFYLSVLNALFQGNLSVPNAFIPGLKLAALILRLRKTDGSENKSGRKGRVGRKRRNMRLI